MIGMPSYVFHTGRRVIVRIVLDESFSFMLLGWRAEKTPGGYIMISPRVAADSSTDSRSPGCGGYRSYEFICVVRCGASVGALTDFGGIGRGGQG